MPVKLRPEEPLTDEKIWLSISSLSMAFDISTEHTRRLLEKFARLECPVSTRNVGLVPSDNARYVRYNYRDFKRSLALTADRA
ncbi:hypothetical protein ICN84_01485 [Akkermansia glycaniphila]|uniref:hypothetical protein n=1 Tax=Akkermansia glycaniphila TaxID=1679444 RepID=UPI001C00F559|nr:hypothetical protein [Akkermansia glycaniphila]MBT9448742.1 hypothetical protein [Akkermansia glycaniphila]